MAEEIIVYIVVALAFFLATRWIYRAASGKKEACGCDCSIGSCLAANNCHTLSEPNCSELPT